ncbi:ETEC_3214 domain-containing protein [Rheinheimera mangrovi]|uniref:ETEC_3214 domain-containing protein n=1 Tax=Rheinheimera mangrovi TaxID=2498451 RepID=UPI000F8F4DCE|nr:ETEC_3214 domain-containing protein [Rheinheimera mangrovi]
MSLSVGHLFFQKIRSVAFTLAALVLAIGQWADFRDVVTSTYEGFITHFTDKVELKQLSHVRVGANLSFLETLFGPAKLIKVKDSEKKSQYRYYDNDKFLLALAVENGRVSAYQIISLQEGFQPSIGFSKNLLNSEALQNIQKFDGTFSTDTVNLRYYLEQATLGREGMFFEQQLGFIEYGSGSQTYAELEQINEQLLLAGDNEKLLPIVEKLRAKLIPNVYSIGELSLEQAADMLLTRYEFHAYFAHGKPQ